MFYVENSMREQILQRFEKWLDEVLAEEVPLRGIDQDLLSELEDGNGSGAQDRIDTRLDLYSTWSAMTALTQEVKLQGRAFKHLNDNLETMSGQGESVDGLLEGQSNLVAGIKSIAENIDRNNVDRENKLKISARAGARRGFISVLLDIRDRLIIGLKSVENSQLNLDENPAPAWISRLFLKKRARMNHVFEIARSLKAGYELSIDRLDEALQHFGVNEIVCLGEPFDARLMTAVDIEETADIPDGTVLEVYRTGYMLDAEVFQPVQVKVSRKAVKGC